MPSPSELWGTFYTKFPIFAYEPAKEIKLPTKEEKGLINAEKKELSEKEEGAKKTIKGAFLKLIEGNTLLKQHTEKSAHLSGFKFFTNPTKFGRNQGNFNQCC
ncbi:Uncharacterised protein [Legionella steigerwaltii]|uniref:Uncharacterized protein n=1 Tax=Legionella steigerwaltii TaxID=460 RepID=A0A378LCT6_9GAMM|nr:hypothetical protein [Legionella steigerwaltii]KTD75335.1 hypothetical protein Lstg_2510 [Legionella steigerwaltii]STY23692.1 Uncharacterised protein [Legionella steigerwaltii]